MSKYLAFIKLLSGPLAAGCVYLISPGDVKVTAMAAITAWVAIWWLTEATHLAVTSLLPFVLLPMLGIMDAKSVAFQYMDQVIFLFIGGFLIAFAIERWNLHRRIALGILMVVGTSPAGLLFGVMLSTFLLSMWISNTATVMMLISAVLALIHETDRHLSKGKDKLATALLLGLAYAASIGGMATVVGTPTNMIFVSFYNKTFPGIAPVTFTSWMAFAFLIAIVFLLLAFVLIRYMFIKKGTSMAVEKNYFRDQYRTLGKMSHEEKMVSLLFVVTALLWFFRVEIPIGSFVIPGWSDLMSHPEYVQDSTVAIAMALLLFLIPSKTEKGKMLLSWEEGKKLPFGIVLLFGGGFALAKGFDTSGLSNWLAGHLSFFAGASPFLIIFGICIIVTLLSEFASNVASIQLMLPVLVSVLPGLGVSPLLLMVPATLAASLGYMLPVATAPNTIVYGTGRIPVKEMMITGLLLDVIGIAVVTLAMMVFGIK